MKEAKEGQEAVAKAISVLKDSGFSLKTVFFVKKTCLFLGMNLFLLVIIFLQYVFFCVFRCLLDVFRMVLLVMF